MPELDYTVQTDRPFDETVAALETIAAHRGMRVLVTHDVQGTLAEKGFERGPYKIIEVCQAASAHQVLAADEKIGLFMPCKILVYRKAHRTVVCGQRPLAIAEFFPEADLGDTPQRIDALLRGIIDEVAKT